MLAFGLKFMIPRLNALAPPTSALFHFLTRISISDCNVILNVGFINFVRFIKSEKFASQLAILHLYTIAR